MTSNLVTMTCNLVTMTRRPPLSSLCILLLYLLSQQPIGGVQHLDGGRLEPVPFDRHQPLPSPPHQTAPLRARGHAHILLSFIRPPVRACCRSDRLEAARVRIAFAAPNTNSALLGLLRPVDKAGARHLLDHFS